MLSRHWLIPALALMLLATAARAQEGALRVAVCNPGKVWEKLDERKALEDKLKGEQDRISGEAQRRKQEVDELKTQRDGLKADSAQYQEKNTKWMEKALEFEVWARLKQTEMQRIQKEQIKSLFQKIEDATKELAEEKKLDLVLAERRPDIPEDITPLTADDLRARLSQRDVLYRNKNADITDLVTLRVNEKYAKTQAGGAPAPK
jgi:Skp family chaperone for outer membrane proteins